MNNTTLLIVHPHEPTRTMMRAMLLGMGYRIDDASNFGIGLRMLAQERDALVLASGETAEAAEFLVSMHRNYPHVPVLLLRSITSSDPSNLAMRYGVSAVLKFPMPTNQLRAAVILALNRQGQGSNPPAKPPVATQPEPPMAVQRPVEVTTVPLGEDPVLLQSIELARAIAPTRNPALIVGEPGTGKTLLARMIHELSPRREGPFIEVACNAPETGSLEKELFGGKRDGFVIRLPGKVAQAQGGTSSWTGSTR